MVKCTNSSAAVILQGPATQRSEFQQQHRICMHTSRDIMPHTAADQSTGNSQPRRALWALQSCGQRGELHLLPWRPAPDGR